MHKAGCPASPPEQPPLRSLGTATPGFEAFTPSRDRHSSGGPLGLALPSWVLVEEARGGKASFEGTAALQVS